MKTTHLTPCIFAIFIVSLLFTSCKKDGVNCKIDRELTDRKHLVDPQQINQIAEFRDTLAKYPHLQVINFIDDNYLYGIHCNVFYQDLIVFTSNYTVFKSKENNVVFTLSEPFVETPQLSLTPTLSHSEAIKAAKKRMNFKKTCISYRLGIYDANISNTSASPNYKLVWKVQGNNGIPYVILDANSGEVYGEHDGKYE